MWEMYDDGDDFHREMDERTGHVICSRRVLSNDLMFTHVLMTSSRNKLYELLK